MDEEVARRVRPPGILLALVGALVMLSNLFGLAWLGWFVVLPVATDLAASGDVALELPRLVSQAPFLASSALALGGGLLMLIGGVRLSSARSPAIIYLGATAAMLPCSSGFAPVLPIPCCCIGFPLGAWAVLVLQDPAVRAAMVRA